MADEKKPTLPSGIGEAEFNTWKHHPVTRAYLQYLMDWREFIKGAAIEAWEGGNISLAVADEARGVANTLRNVAEPDFGEVVKFYESRKQEMQDDESSDGKQSAEG